MRVARRQLGFERREPGEQPLGQRGLLSVEPAQPLGQFRHRPGGVALQRGERRLDGALGVAEPVEPPLEPGQRLGRRRALEPAEPALHRREPGEHRRHRRVLLGMQPAQLLQQRRLLRRPGLPGARGQRRLGGRLRRGLGCGLGALQSRQPLAQPLEQAARLGGVADLLQRAHPAAQLVEPGERGLQRGVLVADQPQQLAGGRLQPLLGAAGAVEPRREAGLALLERREAQLEPVRHRREVGGPCPGPISSPIAALAAGDPPAPLPRRPGDGEQEQPDRAGQNPGGADDSEWFHAPASPGRCLLSGPMILAEMVRAGLMFPVA